MKKTTFTEEKIIGAVKQMESGRAVKEVARELGVTTRRYTTGRPSTAAWRSATRNACGFRRMKTGD